MKKAVVEVAVVTLVTIWQKRVDEELILVVPHMEPLKLHMKKAVMQVALVTLVTIFQNRDDENNLSGSIHGTPKITYEEASGAGGS